jgi:hypothetical protein
MMKFSFESCTIRAVACKVLTQLSAERFDRFISSARVDEVDISKTLKPPQNRNVAKMLPKGGSGPSKKGDLSVSRTGIEPVTC